MISVLHPPIAITHESTLPEHLECLRAVARSSIQSLSLSSRAVVVSHVNELQH